MLSGALFMPLGGISEMTIWASQHSNTWRREIAALAAVMLSLFVQICCSLWHCLFAQLTSRQPSPPPSGQFSCSVRLHHARWKWWLNEVIKQISQQKSQTRGEKKKSNQIDNYECHWTSRRVVSHDKSNKVGFVPHSPHKHPGVGKTIRQQKLSIQLGKSFSFPLAWPGSRVEAA